MARDYSDEELASAGINPKLFRMSGYKSNRQGVANKFEESPNEDLRASLGPISEELDHEDTSNKTDPPLFKHEFSATEEEIQKLFMTGQYPQAAREIRKLLEQRQSAL